MPFSAGEFLARKGCETLASYLGHGQFIEGSDKPVRKIMIHNTSKKVLTEDTENINNLIN